jgi:hypothetical protein
MAESTGSSRHGRDLETQAMDTQPDNPAVTTERTTSNRRDPETDVQVADIQPNSPNNPASPTETRDSTPGVPTEPDTDDYGPRGIGFWTFSADMVERLGRAMIKQLLDTMQAARPFVRSLSLIVVGIG